MARRGSNAFKHNDGIRALRVARDGGLEPSALEIVVGADGAVTFRVYGEDAVPTSSAEPGVSKEWQDEIDKLKKPT
jgi:hypothetical protein